MTRTTTAFAALTAALCLGTIVASCGGTRAALNATVFPGDREVNGRRLASLAGQFEEAYGCTEADTITITGLAPAVYHVDGCSHTLDFQLQCHMGGYGGRQNICEWIAFEDLAIRAGADFSGCDPAAVDIQVLTATTRAVTGCGYRATYMVQCRGGSSCAWILSSRIEADSGGAGGGNGAYTY